MKVKNMKLKKDFSKEDSMTLFLCVCLPPIGYILARNKQWISSAIAIAGSIVYCGAAYGLVASGYPLTSNDVITINALWGVAMVISIGDKFFASKNMAILVKVMLLLVLGFITAMYTPWVSFDCILNCKEIIFRTLRGGNVTLIPGLHLIVFLISLYCLFGIAVFLSIANDDR
jgi:hypothetical protein